MTTLPSPPTDLNDAFAFAKAMGIDMVVQFDGRVDVNIDGRKYGSVEASSKDGQ